MNSKIQYIKSIFAIKDERKIALKFSYLTPNLQVLIDNNIESGTWKFIVEYSYGNDSIKSDSLNDENLVLIQTGYVENVFETIIVDYEGGKLRLRIKEREPLIFEHTWNLPKGIERVNAVKLEIHQDYFDMQVNEVSQKYELKYLVYKNRSKDFKKDILIDEICNGANTYRFSKLPIQYLRKGDVWNLFLRYYHAELNEYHDLRLFSIDSADTNLSLSTAVNEEGEYYNTRLYVTTDQHISYSIHDYSPMIKLTEVNLNRSNQIECTLSQSHVGSQKYSIIMRHRKTGLEQELNYIVTKLNTIKFNFTDNYEKTMNLPGIWDLFIVYKDKGSKTIYKRIKANKEPKYIYLNKNLFVNDLDISLVRFYVTADQEASFYIDDPLMTFHSINQIKGKIVIDASFESDLLKKESITVDAYINNIKKSSAEIINNNNSAVRFKITLENNDLTLDQFNPDTVVMANLKVENGNRTYKLNLVHLIDGYKASQFMKYPGFKVNSVAEIQPIFKGNSLYFKPRYRGNAEVLKINHQGMVIHHHLQDTSQGKYSIGLYHDGKFITITNHKNIDNPVGKVKFKWLFHNELVKNLPSNQSLIQLYLITDNGSLFYPIKIDKKKLSFELNCKNEQECLQLSFKQRRKKLFLQIKSVVSQVDWKYKVKFQIAKIVAKFSSNKKIWLVGENLGLSMQDNGYLFYDSAKKKQVKEDVKYIYRNNIHSDVPIEKDMLRYDSFKHFVYYFRSDKLIVSHGIRDVLPSIYHHNKRNTKPIIYLQHGIVAFKKLGFNSNSYNGMLEKMVVSSAMEKSIFIKKMRFKEKQVINTGLVRYDYLVDESHTQYEKMIFIMPTWRDWLVNNENDFVQSKYYRHYSELINSSKLNSFLKTNNIRIKFLPHIEIRLRYMHLFNSSLSNIDVVDDNEQSIQSLIKKSSLLVTDYSSICFDFAYLNKPVIFYQFDLDEYLAYRGSFVNMYTELFGPSESSLDELINQIKLSFKNSFLVKSNYAKIAKQYINHRDKNNFQRIYELIKEK